MGLDTPKQLKKIRLSLVSCWLRWKRSWRMLAALVLFHIMVNWCGAGCALVMNCRAPRPRRFR